MPEQTLSEQEVFVIADRTLNEVVARIRDDQWDMPMPPDFARRDTDAGADAARPSSATTRTTTRGCPTCSPAGRWPRWARRRTRATCSGTTRRPSFAALVDSACAAVEALDDLSRTVHCSFGDFTAQHYLWQVTLFRGMRAHDIGQVVGADVPLPPALVQGIWHQVRPRAEEWRSYGVFPAEVPVPDDAPLLDRLLGLTGRRPDTSTAA